MLCGTQVWPKLIHSLVFDIWLSGCPSRPDDHEAAVVESFRYRLSLGCLYCISGLEEPLVGRLGGEASAFHDSSLTADGCLGCGGVDLNHRPLGYEFSDLKDSSAFQGLDAAGRDTKSLERHKSIDIGP